MKFQMKNGFFKKNKGRVLHSPTSKVALKLCNCLSDDTSSGRRNQEPSVIAPY